MQYKQMIQKKNDKTTKVPWLLKYHCRLMPFKIKIMKIKYKQK